MNMHMNPLDDESSETLARHKAILQNHSDDFVAYIYHIENARKQNISHKIYEQKLQEFAKVDESQDEETEHPDEDTLRKTQRSPSEKMLTQTFS
mmetsp:Transcript_10356/g.15917  ORF Transcript_10356/g.15917 Transcript_10356/m.15917 type:complete len:94 (+) Transcript_10356:72-353(+)